jgi:hypothetical protein
VGIIDAFWKAAAAVLIAYVIAVSSVADFLAHECGNFWFGYTFQLSDSIASLAFFGIFGVVVFLICMIRPVGAAVHWWFWIAFAVAVLIANSLYAQTAPLDVHTATGGNLQCALRR